MPPVTKIDYETKNHLSLSEKKLLQLIFCCLTFLGYLLFVTRNHIASNLTKFMAT
jgi:hypothetical protein